MRWQCGKSGNFPINWASWARCWRPKRRKRRYLVWAIDADRIRVFGFLPFIYMMSQKSRFFGYFSKKSTFWETKSQDWQVCRGVPEEGLFWKSGNFPVPLGACACLWRTYRPLFTKLTHGVSADTFELKSGFCSLCILIGRKNRDFWGIFRKNQRFECSKSKVAARGPTNYHVGTAGALKSRER